MKTPICIAMCLMGLVAPSAWAVDSIAITGFAIDGGSSGGTAPVATPFYLASGPAKITLGLESGETDVILFLQALNGTLDDWEGYLLELDGAVFASPPAVSFGGPSSTPLSATSAILFESAPSNGSYFIDVELTASKQTVVLTATPLLTIPEPGTLAILAPITAALLCRRRGRG